MTKCPALRDLAIKGASISNLFLANDFVHYLINLLFLLRNCYQNDINFGKDTAYLRNIKEKPLF